MSRPAPRSVLALDVGRKRIGLAGCDALGLTVTPLPALRRGRYPADLEHLRSLVAQRRITALVVGLPLDAQQQPTEQAEHCRRYGERLARHLALPLALVNEFASSWAAAERHGLHGDRSGALDSAAAALLLEQWLLDASAALEVARRCRGTPRIANRLLRRVRDVAAVGGHGRVSPELVHEALSLHRVDGRGLDASDRRLLHLLQHGYGGGPVGLDTLAAGLGEDPATLEAVVEPFLLQQGLLQRTPRGRVITEAGLAHLQAHPEPSAA